LPSLFIDGSGGGSFERHNKKCWTHYTGMDSRLPGHGHAARRLMRDIVPFMVLVGRCAGSPGWPGDRRMCRKERHASPDPGVIPPFRTASWQNKQNKFNWLKCLGRARRLVTARLVSNLLDSAGKQGWGEDDDKKSPVFFVVFYAGCSHSRDGS
jgi:hypothetical protein